MRPHPSPRAVRTACLLLFACGLTTIAGASQPAPSGPARTEAQLRELLNLPLGFESYVFSGPSFPAARFERPARAEALLGPHSVRATFYDRDYRRVETARKPGLYGAVIEVAPQQGRPLKRYATLFRVPAPLTRNLRLERVPSELVPLAGLNDEVVAQQTGLIEERLQGRTLGELERDARFARLLAGLSRSRAGDGPVRKSDDAYAVERQWWVGLKRKLTGMDRQYARKFTAPLPLQGKPAPVVREGTPAEAGMKPDAAEKIDAACREWAADTDQAFAVCVVRHGVIVLHRAYGMRDGKPMTVDTRSWMASVTKTMSATLMLMLVDQGLVDLDGRADKFLPALRDQPVATPLTIRHLYTHTGGLSAWPGWNDELPDVEERVADYYPLLKVGHEWGYTGTGNMLGGKIIELISGESVPAFFQNHLLRPLGATQTDVIGTHADTFSVPLDMAKFGQMLLNRGAYGKRRFFRAETFQKMLPQKLTRVLGSETTKTFGIGLDGQPERFGHGAASAATFSVDVTDDLVVIMTRNAIGKNYDKYNGKFWQAIRDGIDRSPRRGL